MNHVLIVCRKGDRVIGVNSCVQVEDTVVATSAASLASLAFPSVAGSLFRLFLTALLVGQFLCVCAVY